MLTRALRWKRARCDDTRVLTSDPMAVVGQSQIAASLHLRRAADGRSGEVVCERCFCEKDSLYIVHTFMRFGRLALEILRFFVYFFVSLSRLFWVVYNS